MKKIALALIVWVVVGLLVVVILSVKPSVGQVVGGIVAGVCFAIAAMATLAGLVGGNGNDAVVMKDVPDELEATA